MRYSRVSACALLLALVVLVAPPAASADPGKSTHFRLGYTTGLVTSTSGQPSLLPVSDGTDIASLATGAPVSRPLAEQLQLMFEAFFSAAGRGSTQTVQLQVGYSYSSAPDLGPTTQLPVAIVPAHPFAVPADWSPGTACQDAPEDSAFVCQVTQVIRQWVESHQPIAADGQLTFNLAARPSGSTLPLVRVSGLTLARVDISDL